MDYILAGPILNETIMSTIDDAVITIQWSILTDGGESIVRYLVDWIVPGSNQYVRAPGGTIESDVIYLEISLSRVLAERIYQYRIQGVNSDGFISDYVFFDQQSSKGSYIFTYTGYSRACYHWIIISVCHF